MSLLDEIEARRKKRNDAMFGKDQKEASIRQKEASIRQYIDKTPQGLGFGGMPMYSASGPMPSSHLKQYTDGRFYRGDRPPNLYLQDRQFNQEDVARPQIRQPTPQMHPGGREPLPFALASMGNEQGLTGGNNPLSGLFGYLKTAEGLGQGFHEDPSAKTPQTNYGYGVKATPKVRRLVETMRENNFDEQEIADAVLRGAISERRESARRKFGAREWDQQPADVQDLMVELEYNTGSINKWPTLVRAAKARDYHRVSQEMSNAEVDDNGNPISGMKRRNELRDAQFNPEQHSAPVQPPLQTMSPQDLFNNQFNQDVQVPQKGISAMPKPSFIPKGISAMPKPAAAYRQSQQAPQQQPLGVAGVYTPQQMAQLVAQSQAASQKSGLGFG